MLYCVKAWIVLAAVTTASGWCLSFLGCLNAAGYLALGLPLLAIGAASRPLRDQARILFRRAKGARKRWRFRQWPPVLFGLLSFCCLVGGLLYTPANPDSVVYRIPRTLHWIAEGRWHWIHTNDPRMNIVGTGMEFLYTPLMLLTRTDRLLFLINFLSYLLLPGLLFFVFRKLGVRPRTAWWWMWLLPTGYCYVMQAGGVGNDSFSAVFILTALGFALQAKEEKNERALWISILAMALASGSKQTNVALGLPWLVAVAPALYLLGRRPLSSVAVVGLAGLCSMLPLTLLNLRHVGTWTGWPPGTDLQPRSALWGFAGNLFAILAQNLVPPIFPWATQWNELMLRFQHGWLGAHFTDFEHFAQLGRAVTELTAGVGLPVFVMILAAGGIGPRRAGGQGAVPAARTAWHIWCVRWSILLPLLVFFCKVGSFTSARYLAPYYPLALIPLLCWRRMDFAVRHRGWQRLALGLGLSTVAVIVVSRDRPLWPAEFGTRQLARWWPANGYFQKLSNSYAFTEQLRARENPFAAHLPAAGATIGYAANYAGQRELVCWQPFGATRVYRVTGADTLETLARHGVGFLAVQEDFLTVPQGAASRWLAQLKARPLGVMHYHPTPDADPDQITLWALPPGPEAQGRTGVAAAR